MFFLQIWVSSLSFSIFEELYLSFKFHEKVMHTELKPINTYTYMFGGWSRPSYHENGLASTFQVTHKYNYGWKSYQRFFNSSHKQEGNRWNEFQIIIKKYKWFSFQFCVNILFSVHNEFLGNLKFMWFFVFLREKCIITDNVNWWNIYFSNYSNINVN